MSILFLIYTALYIILLPFILPVHYIRRPKPIRKRWLNERFGYISKGSLKKADRKRRPTIWIHAVSVGEALAAKPLIRELRKKADILVSTVTDTGQEVASDFMDKDEGLIYVPLDIPTAVRRTIEGIKPDLIIVMETELWPNLFRTAKRMGIPAVIVNGRISANSFSGYRKISFFIKPVLHLADTFCMQTDMDASRIMELGGPEDRVMVTGNLKLDITPPTVVPEWCKALSRPVIVAGSTHDGEEDLILEAFMKIKADYKGASLILAPRHPQRSREIEYLIQSRGISYSNRSDNRFSGRDVIILDTIGELSSVYGSADLCIIGGSFIPRGGQNLFEPASWSKPVICGPHMGNFPLAAGFFQEGAAITTEREGLKSTMESLLSDSARAEEMGRKAKALYLQNRGAVGKTLKVIEEKLSYMINTSQHSS